MPRTNSDDAAEYSITIEFNDFITRFDLDEILASIDGLIEEELFDFFGPDFFFFRRRRYSFPPYLNRDAPVFSYLGITSVESGSITLGVFVGGAVVGYVGKRFKKGVDESLLAKEIQRSGRLVGNVMGRILERINNWAERYVPEQQELGGNITKIEVQERKPRDKSAE
ncbi:hypothetical protein [Dyella acidiphila]|uniref:Uncharacterized protein n=1 Tax=Dyella acidiphila TaxID=2775866 RepID=A0ABR9GFH3_9GAMM|nr:hypothetical protein [Dyella acidiphila]MBE1162795.1 hypothetical protein [Dyella acidiphila]